MNGMYFDEVFHARTGYEFLHGIYPFELTHPPLGKEIIAASIYAFGMTPFGWRFSGAFFGVIMLIVLYVFIKNLFGKTSVAICGTLLLGFDFMRFVQTRIATIDTFGVFFILLSYFFMYRYITTDAGAPFRKSLAPLALSGIAFGIGCASKWIVIFAGLGLAAMYIFRLVMLAKQHREEFRFGFKSYLIVTLLFSMLFFVVIPVIIYCLSYIPYGHAKGMTVDGGMLWDRRYYELIADNQVYMLDYHLNFDSLHPYSSVFWQWIINARPILYVSSSHTDVRSSIGAFGNPVVWWGGFVAVVIMAFRTVKYRDGKALFILIGYLSQLLPWIAVRRVVFAYHYFACTLFLVLALAHVFNTVIDRGYGRYRLAVYGYTASAGGLYAMFYPILTGIYTPVWYFSYLLRWLPVMWPF
jgi:dolichyl-phosphate-mannose--protein O-mannosyl transferase